MVVNEATLWKFLVKINHLMAEFNQSLSTAELFMSLAAPSSLRQSCPFRNSRWVSWTWTQVDQVNCPGPHSPHNGLLTNPDCARETAMILKRAVGCCRSVFDAGKKKSLILYPSFFI